MGEHLNLLGRLTADYLEQKQQQHRCFHFSSPSHSSFLHFPPALFLVLLLLFMLFNICICDSWPQRWNVAESVQQSPFPDNARRVTCILSLPHFPLPPPLPSDPPKDHNHGIASLNLKSFNITKKIIMVFNRND